MQTSHSAALGSGLGRLSSRRGRALFLALIAALATVVAMLSLPALSRADSSSSLTVIGTSDVSDSQLMQQVVEPAFEAAYPQYSISYVGTGTGAAITSAENGTNGASVLIVHAASLENQFVSAGYSYPKGSYGDALFTNKFILAGSPGDPAGIAADDPNNIVQAFIDIAAAGINGNAYFVSRGGTPGTTVEEHTIWALADTELHSSLPSGLLLCSVNAASGGGEAPIAAGNGVTADGQPCPNSGAVPTAAQEPAWYIVTGLTQGPNVQAANNCTYGTGNNCYVLTDDGTYAYLQNSNSIPNLNVVTSSNSSADAVGGQYLLENYFHGYVINPNKPNETVNLPAAQDFINLITSPMLQQSIAAYLSGTTFAQTYGAPYTATASPTITATGPTKVKAGKTAEVTGTVINNEVGYPALKGVTVYLNELSPTDRTGIAVGTVNGKGKYTIDFTPSETGTYDVTTQSISKIENATLNPPFGDVLQPSASNQFSIKVK
jgi:tungstate transport system substrate-binding protein